MPAGSSGSRFAPTQLIWIWDGRLLVLLWSKSAPVEEEEDSRKQRDAAAERALGVVAAQLASGLR